MTEPVSPLTVDQLRELVADRRVDTVQALFPDHYGRLLGKRFAAGFFLEHVLEGGTHACDYLLTVDMEMNPIGGYEFANWERGYGDMHLVPDPRTLRVCDWEDRTALVLCDAQRGPDHAPVRPSPRAILRVQVRRLHQAGYDAVCGSELEYYLFRDSYDALAGRDHAGLRAHRGYLIDYHGREAVPEAEFHGAVRRHLRSSDVPVECTKGEWGEGQHELNLCAADPLNMADRHGLLKLCLKSVADRMGMSVTFMAKVTADRAGSSCHLHLSLWENGRNAFCGGDDFGGVRCSALLRWFLGGWIARAPEVMVWYAPTVNSYKRYQPGSWAPTRLGCGIDNRTAAFRLIERGSNVWVECRIPGADCNPYLVFAAALASGLDGIDTRTESPSPRAGNLYQVVELPSLPLSLSDAVGAFERSEFCRRSFGNDVVDHYAHFYRTESIAYSAAVTDWERNRYFERI
jgi:glutamine synthetase